MKSRSFSLHLRPILRRGRDYAMANLNAYFIAAYWRNPLRQLPSLA
ncbi:MAG: hypothetical protein ACI9BW_002797 [Gammaproteobacteria bacterium]|jgi:hypothetical protein